MQCNARCRANPTNQRPTFPARLKAGLTRTDMRALPAPVVPSTRSRGEDHGATRLAHSHYTDHMASSATTAGSAHATAAAARAGGGAGDCAATAGA